MKKYDRHNQIFLLNSYCSVALAPPKWPPPSKLNVRRTYWLCKRPCWWGEKFVKENWECPPPLQSEQRVGQTNGARTQEYCRISKPCIYLPFYLYFFIDVKTLDGNERNRSGFRIFCVTKIWEFGYNSQAIYSALKNPMTSDNTGDLPGIKRNRQRRNRETVLWSPDSIPKPLWTRRETLHFRPRKKTNAKIEPNLHTQARERQLAFFKIVTRRKNPEINAIFPKPSLIFAPLLKKSYHLFAWEKKNAMCACQPSSDLSLRRSRKGKPRAYRASPILQKPPRQRENQGLFFFFFSTPRPSPLKWPPNTWRCWLCETEDRGADLKECRKSQKNGLYDNHLFDNRSNELREKARLGKSACMSIRTERSDQFGRGRENYVFFFGFLWWPWETGVTGCWIASFKRATKLQGEHVRSPTNQRRSSYEHKEPSLLRG